MVLLRFETKLVNNEHRTRWGARSEGDATRCFILDRIDGVAHTSCWSSRARV